MGQLGDSLEHSSVEHRVAWLLGTSCCLMSQKEGWVRTATSCSSCMRPGIPGRSHLLLACHFGHVAGMEALPPCSPWVDAFAGPRGRPLPRRLYSLLFREAQADVVNLNCFLIRLAFPGLGWVSSAGNLDCITRTTCSSRNPAKDWESLEWAWRGWVLQQLPGALLPGGLL